MLRNIVVLLAGLIVAGASIGLIALIIHKIKPPPLDPDNKDPIAMDGPMRGTTDLMNPHSLWVWLEVPFYLRVPEGNWGWDESIIRDI